MAVCRAALLGLAVALALVSPAGASGGLYGDDDGFFVFLDAALTTPGDTDQVVGYSRELAPVQSTTPLVVDWSAGVGGTLGFGYRWGDNRVSASFWHFDDDATFATDGTPGGQIEFAIGPISYPAGFLPITNGVPGSVDFTSSIEASSINVEWAHAEQVGDFFDLEWSVGLRFASFEEDLDGHYDYCAISTGCDPIVGPVSTYYYYPGDIAFDVAKSNEGDMAGVRVGATGTYFFTDTFAVSSEIGYSVLGGDLESRSGLTATGVLNASTDPPTLAIFEDDDRTGYIREVGVSVQWFLVDGRLRLSLGYAHARWDGIAGDLLRNTPGILNANKDRDFITFSGLSFGARFDF